MQRIYRSLGIFLLAFSVTSFGASTAALNKLESVKTQVKQKHWHFTVGYSPVTELTLENATGLKIPTDWTKKARFNNVFPTAALPSSFDWRTEAGGLTPIKNQGGCGGCWAFATVGVLESIIKIRDGITTSLSEQQLISCNSDGWSCGGGYFAHQYHVSPGAATTDDFPYAMRNERCKSGLTYTEHLEDWNYVGAQGRSPTIDEMKAAIQEYGPIAVTMAATTNFQYYHGGIYDADDGRATNHVVNLVGWNDDGQYWILRNSWGADWGEQGYARIQYGSNSVGDQATYVIYKSACTPQAIAYAGSDKTIAAGQSVQLGGMPVEGQTYSWTPSTGLDDATSATPTATPTTTTTYTLVATSTCGTSQQQVTVTVK